MFEIVLTQRALKDFDGLSEDVKNRIGVKLRDYSNDPLKFARKLTNPKIGTYRFRVGDYRIIFDIEDNTIVILRVGHRKEIYK